MLNKVFLLGTVSEYGVTVKPLPESGSMQGQFTVVLEEPGADGRTFTTWIACECYGRALTQAEQLHPGDTVILEGKLKRRQRHSKSGEQFYDTCVLAWSVQALVPQTAGAAVTHG